MKKTLYTLLLATMFPCALANQQYWVKGVTQEQGWFDANKTPNSTYGQYNGWFNNADDGDGFLCWAASASDILAWWHSQNPGATEVNPNAPSELESIWSLFKANYHNGSGSAEHGVEWYINGALTTSEPYPRESASKAGGLYPSVSVAVENYDIRRFDPAYKVIEGEILYWPDESDRQVDVYLEIATTMKRCINDGYIISLGISGTSGSKHATTLWGIELDDDGYLSKMWITDSDDYLNGYVSLGEDGSETGLIELDCTRMVNEMWLNQELGLKYGDQYAYGIQSDGTSYQGTQFPDKVNRLWYSYNEAENRNDYFYEFTAIKLSSVAAQEPDRVPEPASGTLGLLALAGLCGRRRRK